MGKVTTPDLYDAATAKIFYEKRYSGAYMDEWPLWKKRRVLELIRGLELPRRGQVVDFGCGAGVFTEVLHQALPDWSVYGTDLSETALEKARARFPHCTFFSKAEASKHQEAFDLVFSHHVFEHVPDLDGAWADCISFLKPTARMLHILPCGNEGSLEHHICSLRADGIDSTLGNRFFFEDIGHVRRLSTREVVELGNRRGFSLLADFYANQYHGAFRWIVTDGERFIRKLTDTAQARSADAVAELLRIRKKLLRYRRLAAFAARYREWRAKLGQGIKYWAAVAAGSPLYALCRYSEARLHRLADREWQQCRSSINGSEMYLFLGRGNQGFNSENHGLDAEKVTPTYSAPEI